MEDDELAAIAAEREKQQRRRRQNIFDQFDRDKSGRIAAADAAGALRQLGAQRTEDELRAACGTGTGTGAGTGAGGPQTMTFEQFDRLFSPPSSSSRPKRGAAAGGGAAAAAKQPAKPASASDEEALTMAAELRERERHRKRRELFDTFDADKSGTIDATELEGVMRALGVQRTGAELRALVGTATGGEGKGKGGAASGSGAGPPAAMTFEQFDSLFLTSRLKDVFDEADADGSGTLSPAELFAALRRAGHRLTQQQCDTLLSTLDKDNSNEIDFEEFRTFFENVPNASMAAVAQHWDNTMLLSNMGSSVEEVDRRRKRRDLFNKFDRDNSGDIDINEFKNIMKELGVQKSAAELGAIIRSVSNGCAAPASMTFDQFDRLFSTSRLKDVFDAVDADKSGTITAPNLRFALQKLGHKITQRQCDDMIKKLDKDNNNVIDFEEFRLFFENVPLASLASITAHWENSVFITDTGTNDMAPTIHRSGTGLEWWQTVLAGGVAGIMSRTVTAPLEKVIITSQTGLDKGVGMVSFIKNVYRQQGIRGLFAGNLLNCMRVFPTAGLTCTIYLNLLALTPADSEFDAMEPVYRMGCAGAAALVGNTLTYPMDLLRARITVQEPANASIVANAKSIYSEGGVRAFFTGIRPTLIAVVPFVAMQNAVIDILRDEASNRGVTPSPAVLLAVGACAGLLAQSVVYPLDVLRRRMQVQNNGGATEANVRIVGDRTWLAMKNVVAMHGVRSLYAGIVPTFLKTMPAIGVVSLVTNSINSYYRHHNAAVDAEGRREAV
jgi:solute carrier family 25 phosphate transporter 23/24/25/41